MKPNFPNHLFLKRSLLILPIIILVVLASQCKRIPDRTQEQGTTDSIPAPAPPITYNFYLENSGSMRGYFSNVDSNLKTIIKEYYDRIDENNGDADTITLNYINTDIKRFNSKIGDYVKSASLNCTAKFTELDSILAMAMDSLKDNHVNIVISDYSFTSNDSGLAAAKSGITKLFAKRLKNKRDLSVAIIKYDCDFKGKYFPGGISCNHSLPIYVWAFGSSSQIKKITQLDIKEKKNIMVMQPWKELQPGYQVKNSRMVDKTDNSIIVSKWKKDRDDGLYRLIFNVDMSSVALTKPYILDPNNYHITGNYKIESIQQDKISKDIYTYKISTDQPSPSTISINLINEIPSWVEESNFSGNGVPCVGTTYGIQALIEGVYDAYNNKNDGYITINIKLK